MMYGTTNPHFWHNIMHRTNVFSLLGGDEYLYRKLSFIFLNLKKVSKKRT